MSIRSRIMSLWRNVRHRGGVEAALNEELDSYVDLAAARYERDGLSRPDARRRALVDAGGIEQVKERVRDAWTGNLVALVWRDIRYSIRSLRRSPGFSIVAVATLALGLAGATAVFSIMNAVLLRPLPGITDAARLVTLQRVQRKATLEEFAYPDFRDFRAGTRTLAGLAAQCGWGMRLGDTPGERRSMIVDFVSGEYFSVLGVRPALGRLLTPADEAAGRGNAVLVLRYDVWRDQFNGDSAIVGRALRLNGVSFTIVGVATPGFAGTMTAHAVAGWAPLAAILAAPSIAADMLTDRGAGWLDLFGRLAPGATIADAQRDLDAIAARLALTYSTNAGRGVRVTRFAGLYIDEEHDARSAFQLLGAAVTLLLLLACANVASLSLVRAGARQRELASRLALGASHAALLRQMFIEGMLIAGAAVLVGTAAAEALVHARALLRTAMSGVPLVDAPLDARVLMFALLAAVTTAVLVSMLPAIRAGRADPMMLLKDGTSGSGRRRSAAQRTLVALQAAGSLTLLIIASLVFGTFHRLVNQNPGFDPRGVAVAVFDPREEGLDSAHSRKYFQVLLDRAATTPGIESAALATIVPPQRYADRTAVFRAEDAPSRDVLRGHGFDVDTRAFVDEVSPSFFATLRIPILRGRPFTGHDDANVPPVVVVSRSLAARLWPNANPIGRYLVWPEDDRNAEPRPPSEVVGIAGDTRHSVLGGDLPLVMYVPLDQQDVRYADLIVRGRTAAPSPATMRRIAAAADAAVPASGLSTLQERMVNSVLAQRSASMWIGALGVIALALASIGLYGVASQSVLQRRRELAVRSALGATPGDLAALVMREGTQLAAAGVVGGLALSIAGTRAAERFVIGIEQGNPVYALGCAALLAAVMLAAAYIPARRASRLDPVDALRCD
jgi:predicted permease